MHAGLDARAKAQNLQSDLEEKMGSPRAAHTTDQLTFTETGGRFADRYTKVPVFQVAGGRYNFAAFVYTCRLNLDLDGAANTYGYDNPAKGSPQKHLAPLESWHTGKKGVSTATSQKVGLGNACGDPGDGTKGFRNFLDGNRNFYWAGVKALTKEEARRLNVKIDDRPELEAGLSAHPGHGKPQLKPVGMGCFPVVQPDTGYYISTTSVVTDASLSIYDARRYLDSSEVPYAVWANNWKTIGIGGKHVRQGDFGLAIQNSTGAAMPYVYGDSGTLDKVGECSRKLNYALGRGAGYVTFIAFPGSGSGNALGRHPLVKIGFHVLMNTMKLQKHASELAARMAMGRAMATPGNGADMNEQQYRIFKRTLSTWTLAG
jgi:hypothetical protein